jgi:hypothetical protein
MSVSQNLPNVTIGFSRGRLLTLFGICLVLTLLSSALAFTWQQGKTITTFDVSVCYVAAVFFGLATWRMLWRLLSSKTPVVTISRSGIRDTRLRDETIAWSAVRKILIREQRTQSFVVLKLDPIVAQRFSGSLLKRALSLMNKALGDDCVIVNASGLTMDVKTLFETCKQYWGVGRPEQPEEAVAETQPQPQPETEAVS